jgi:DNA-binding CsgD family transcriptional regulator
VATATLIGRRTELEVLERVIGAAREGRSGVLVVRGPAGVGKTALLEAAVAPDFRVLRAEGVEAESELAFAGLHQLLRPLTWLLERLPDAQRAALEAMFGVGEVSDRFAVAAGALGVLAEAAEERPLLCVVDDLQWLDRPSVEAIGFVARRLNAEPIALLLAMRDSTPVSPALARFPLLTLSGLARDDARAVLDGVAELAPADRDRVLDAAEGNPLALLELPRGSGTMGTVERSFAERLAKLPKRTRRAVLLAAADDDPSGATALRAVVVADLAEAEADGLVWVTGDRVAFRHPLVRSAAYGIAPFAERSEAHLALAAVLAAPADADRRAWHRAAAAAAPDAEVAGELAQSADRARARGGYAAAAAALERAARLTAPEPLKAQRLVAAADAARLAGDVVHAADLTAEALGLGADVDTVAHATAIRGAIRARRGEFEAGERDLTEAAHTLAKRRPQLGLRIALLAAETAALAGRHEQAEANARWAASLPIHGSDADRALVAHASAMASVLAGDMAEARERVADTLAHGERAANPQLLTWAAAGLVYVGDLRGSVRTIARALALARERGAVADVAFGLQLQAYLELVEGRFSMAATDAAEGLELALGSGEHGAAAHCRALLAWHAAIRGSGDEASALATEAAAATQRPATEAAQRALALLDLGDGRHEAALDRLKALIESPDSHPARRMLAIGDLVEAAVGCGRAEAAHEPLDALRAWTESTGSAWGLATVATAAVQLGGVRSYEAAVAAHQRIALPFDRGRLELRMGELLRRARRRVDARRHLRLALDLFAQTGAAAWERRAAAELRATGETARKRDASTLDDLTPQELQIARMVAEGATNREIAGRLFLSPRTVDYHLRKVFQKLGLTSRTQLAALDW